MMPVDKCREQGRCYACYLLGPKATQAVYLALLPYHDFELRPTPLCANHAACLAVGRRVKEI